MNLNDTLDPVREHLHAGGTFLLSNTENGDLAAYAVKRPASGFADDGSWRYVVETSRDGRPLYADPPCFTVEALVGQMGLYGPLGAWESSDAQTN